MVSFSSQNYLNTSIVTNSLSYSLWAIISALSFSFSLSLTSLSKSATYDKTSLDKAKRDNKPDSKNQPNSMKVQRCDVNLLKSKSFSTIIKILWATFLTNIHSLTWILISRTKELGKKEKWQRPLRLYLVSPQGSIMLQAITGAILREKNYGSTGSVMS